jgi:hypothetical protein
MERYIMAIRLWINPNLCRVLVIEMSDKKKHPMRCENACGWYETHHRYGCDVLERRLTYEEREIIEVVGCNSHTSVSSQLQQAKQDVTL